MNSEGKSAGEVCEHHGYKENCFTCLTSERDALKAELAKWENESAEENTCKKHPMTIMFYGCLSCYQDLNTELDALKKKVDELEVKLSASEFVCSAYVEKAVVMEQQQKVMVDILTELLYDYETYASSRKTALVEKAKVFLATVKGSGEGK